MIRFISWNIDSINAALTSDSARAQLSRKVLEDIRAHEPDLVAIQETKLGDKGPTKKHREILEADLPHYRYAWVSSREPARKGYAGTMVFYREGLEPIITYPSIGAPEPMDYEGRIVTLEFDKFFFTNVYTPNAGDKLVRLKERQEWDKRYAEYVGRLDGEKPVIATGDYNVAHREIDLANPEGNRGRAGFTDEEREGFTELLARGFTDTFRHLHGDVEGAYTWWAQRVRTSKINNAGWRIDYFLVSDRIKDRVLRSDMMDSGPRQDHAPLILEVDGNLL